MLFNIYNFNSPKLGHLPKEWKVVQLKEVADFSRKPRDLVLKNFAKIPFISMDLIPDDGTQMPGYIFKPGNRISSGTYCEPGDILVAKITPCLENGKQCVVPNFKEGFAFATTEVYALKPKHSIIDCYYLFAILRSPAIRKELASKMEGSTGRQRLPKHVLENLEVPLPPLPEQRAIAYVLRTVQRAKEATERVIAALKGLKRSLMKHLFTYGPVPLDQADQVPLKETEIGPVPEHWEVVRLGEIAKIERGKFAHRPRNDPRFYGGTIPFIQTGDVAKAGGRITSYSQTLNELGLSVSRIFPKGTIVITIAANIGYVGILEFDSAFPDSLIGITPASSVDNVFLAYYLQTQQSKMDRLAPRGTQKNINIQFLKPWPIPKPPLVEQREIARILQAVDRKIEAEENRKQALDVLFKTLLHNLMTAKIRVPRTMVERFASHEEE